MIDIRLPDKKRTRGVVLPPIPKGKSVRISKAPAPSAPTNLKEVFQKHNAIAQNRISNANDT